MIKLLAAINDQFRLGKDVVLCSILASSGSSPRGAGAKMAVFEDASTVGTIGGGAVERICIEQAAAALSQRKSFISSYCLDKNEVNDIGMVCGGNVEVYFQYLSHDHADQVQMFEQMRALAEQRKDAWLIYIIEDKKISRMGVYTPQEGIQSIDSSWHKEIMPFIQRKAALKKGNPMIYAEPLSTSSTVYLFGGGHVGKALAFILNTVGFYVVLFDNRKDMVNLENTPGAAKIIYGDYADIYDKISISENDYVVVMTPGHQGDFEVLNQALASPAAYIGCIGSKHKVAHTTQRLLDQGHAMENIQRIHSPIGLDILAETPEEIAISVAAQMIQHRASFSAISAPSAAK